MDKGFTLIELVVAIVIFALGILGVAKMQMLSIAGNASGNHLSEATNALSSQAEELMGLTVSYDTTGNVDWPDELDASIVHTTGVTSPSGQKMKISWSVEDIDSTNLKYGSLKKIHLAANWKEQVKSGDKNSYVMHATSMGLVRGLNE